MKPSAPARRWLIVGAFGVVVSALLGSGLWAVVVDAGSSRSNRVASAEFSGPHILELAATNSGNTSCQGVSWSDTLPPITIGSADLNEASLTFSTNQRLCIRVVRGGSFRLKIGLRRLLDEETACSQTGMPETRDDPTCGVGDVGELSKVLRLQATYRVASGFQAVSCNTTTASSPLSAWDLDHGGLPLIDCVSVENTGVVTMMPTVSVAQTASEASLNAAQTDRVFFDYAVTVEQG